MKSDDFLIKISKISDFKSFYLRSLGQLNSELLLSLTAEIFIAGFIRFHRHSWEEVKHSIVSEIHTHLSEFKKILERVLNQEPGHYTHCGRQARRTHAVPLQCFLVYIARHY